MSDGAVLSPIKRYHQGLINNDPAAVRSALADEFIMFNGNYSSESTDWQAHMFLSGQSLQDWPANFLKEAGPYENQYDFIHIHIRGDAAIIVTTETGKNKFRMWENEIVTWLLGHRGGQWRIVSHFIRDLRNPE